MKYKCLMINHDDTADDSTLSTHHFIISSIHPFLTNSMVFFLNA